MLERKCSKEGNDSVSAEFKFRRVRLGKMIGLSRRKMRVE
jgi:hypothetical protein